MKVEEVIEKLEIILGKRNKDEKEKKNGIIIEVEME